MPTATTVCHLFPHEDDDGPGNMARDEALLDLVASEPGAAALRTYGWTEPTLSLGYFQGVAEAEADPRWDRVPVVRRPTGGGAIWHDRELTYALVVPKGHFLARRPDVLYRAIHLTIAYLLVGFGVGAGRRGSGETPGSESPRPLLCFTGSDPQDIMVDRSFKVLGSAQRRRSGAVLQHGSLLLGRSPRTPELPGIADLSNAPADATTWAGLLGRRLPEAIGLRAEPMPWPESLRSRVLELEKSVYRNPAWTRRR